MERALTGGMFVPAGPDQCWPWTGKLTDAGYGKAGRAGMAHRFVYERMVGPIPEGKSLDHTCHSRDRSCRGGKTCAHRRCVNPAHLEPVTKRENDLRGRAFVAVNAEKTHCLQGHPYDSANTRLTPKGRRVCRACTRRWVSEYKTRRRLAS